MRVFLLLMMAAFSLHGQDAKSLRSRLICNPLSFTGVNVHLIWNNTTKCLAAGLISGGVTSVFGRTGAVTAQTGDYTAAQVTNAFDKSTNNDIGTGWIDATAGSAPANPSAGKYRMYFKTGVGICQRDNSGTETCLSTATTTVTQLTDLKVTIASNVATLATGKVRCGGLVYTVAATTFTLLAGSAPSYVGFNCLDAGGTPVTLARGSNTMTGVSGYTDTSNVDLSSYGPTMIPLASITASSGVWGAVTELRVLSNTSAPVAGDGLSCGADVNGNPQCAVDGSVERFASSTTVPGSCAVNGHLYVDTDASAGQKLYVCVSGAYELVGGSSTVRINLPFGSTSDAPSTSAGSGWSWTGNTNTTTTQVSNTAPVSAAFSSTAADSSEIWNFIIVPPNYTGGTVALTLHTFPDGAGETNGQVARFKVKSECIAPGTDVRDNGSATTAQNIDITYADVTRGVYTPGTLASFNIDGCVAGGLLRITLYRGGSEATDTLAGIAYVGSVSILF